MPYNQPMHLAGLQSDIAWEDGAANLQTIGRALRAAALPAGTVTVLPEMVASGFTMRADAALAASDRIAGALAELAEELDVHILAGLVRRGLAGPENQLVWFDRRGATAGSYAKQHLFTPTREHEHYQPGREQTTWRIEGATVGPRICYDLRFPEAFGRAEPTLPEVFCVTANWPASRQEHWRALLVARAIENQACLIGVNRTGTDPQTSYAGGSMIVSPGGEILAQADAEPAVIRAEVDIEALLAWRAEFPALADRSLPSD